MRQHVRPSRTRTSIKWAGTVASSALLLLAIISGPWWLTIRLSNTARLWIAQWNVQLFVADGTPGSDFLIAGAPRIGRTSMRPTPPHHFLWFSCERSPGGTQVVVPLWAPLLLTLPWTAVMWRNDIRRRRRQHRGQCLACGYDLSDSKSADVCPECGNPLRSPASE